MDLHYCTVTRYRMLRQAYGSALFLRLTDIHLERQPNVCVLFQGFHYRKLLLWKITISYDCTTHLDRNSNPNPTEQLNMMFSCSSIVEVSINLEKSAADDDY